MTTTKLVLLVTLLFSSLFTFGQADKMRFGKIDKEDLELTKYDLDSSAAAVILGDYGYTSFQFDADAGFDFVMTRHIRIKILNKNGYKYADHDISYYSPEGGGNSEKIGSIKGMTYTLEDGNVVKTKLEKDGIFDENTNEYWKKVKFTMPNIKEGSIIEYKYTIKSNYVRNLRDWVFQYEIPVVSSYYSITIPEFLYYQVQQQGYVSLDNNDMEYRKEKFSYTYWSQTRNGNEKFTGELESNSKVYIFKSSNVPAFKTEPMMTTKSDYLGKIFFELQTIQYPRQTPRNMTDTWVNLGKGLNDSNSFGIPLRAAGFTKKITETVIAGAQSDEEKVNLICSYIKQNMQYNGRNSIYISNLKKSYDEKKGSSSTINLTMLSMLDNAGIEASPVVLSTRDHGFVREHFPNLDQLNYVLVLAKMGDSQVLLDATDSYLPNNMIPENCLNGRGWVIEKDGGYWIGLKNNVKKSIKASATLEISSDGTISGIMKTDYDGYFARNNRVDIIAQGEEKYKEELIEESSWELDELTITDLKNTSMPLSISYNCESEIDQMAGTIYLSPIFRLKEHENIFKTEDRVYPVDYGCAEEKVYYAQIKLPEGYAVEEVPENTVIALPERSGQFMYSVNVQGNILTVLSKLNINKSLFVQNEYPYLRTFFDHVVAKHAEQIVLKKI